MSELKQTRITNSLVRRTSPIPVVGLQDSIPRISRKRVTLRLDPSHAPKPDNEPTQQDTGVSIRQKIKTKRGPIWLEGDSLLCACPDCQAPMSIRLRLLVADCWLCGTSILLNSEQEEAVQELLRQRDEAPAQQPAAHQAAPVDESAETSQPEPQSPAEETEVRPRRRRRRTADDAQRRIARLRRSHSATAWLQEAFRMTPAWVISFVLHIIAILILALFTFGDSRLSETITLSTFVSHDDTEGGDIRIQKPDAQEEYDLPLPPRADLSDRNVRATLQRADQDARELRVDPTPRGTLPSLDKVKKRIATNSDQNFRFSARDPRMRVEIVKKEGGTTLTEAAVARGLRWLARHQNRDGSWSLKGYENYASSRNRGDIAATALALLPFLGAGQTHEHGIYKDNVAAGLNWILEFQKKDGDLRDRDYRIGMYAHGQAAIVLVEALALSGDERFREPAQKAIDFICDFQHRDGGWRYQKGQPGDTSVYGWQMMALQSATSPELGLKVPESTMKLAKYYLDLASKSNGARYSYLPGGESSNVMTAEALLCRMYLGWKKEDPRLRRGLDWLLNKYEPDLDERNIYYWYYATQAFHHYGGKRWTQWNEKMRDVLVTSQRRTGRHAGSWEPKRFRYGGDGDRVYVTALSVCTLEVYYRHLPLFKQIDLD